MKTKNFYTLDGNICVYTRLNIYEAKEKNKKERGIKERESDKETSLKKGLMDHLGESFSFKI